VNSPDPPPSILCLHASVGSGHARAATAVAEALAAIAAERSIDLDGIAVEDTLAHAHRGFPGLYRDAYLALVQRLPEIVGWLYDRFDAPPTRDTLARRLQRIALRPLVELLQRTQPDLVVCTHFLPAELLSMLRTRGLWSGRLAVVVTDFDLHAWWLRAAPDLLFVACDESAETAIRRGVDPARVRTVGIPIDRRFEPCRDRTALRRELELPLDRPVVLLAAGGGGQSALAAVLQGLLAMRRPAHLVAIAGRNESLRHALAAEVSRHAGAVSASVLGFTTRMHEFMAAADLLVSKPGGLTSSEALATGLPMAIVDPLPGQEERNADHLLEWGVAIRCNTPETIGWRIERLLGDAARLRAMRSAALAIGRPHAAREIAVELLGVLATPAPRDPLPRRPPTLAPAALADPALAAAGVASAPPPGPRCA